MKKIIALLIIVFRFFTLTAQVPVTWNTTGIGGGGSMFSPSINPADPNEYYVACDMSELFHTMDFGLSYTIVDFRQLVSSRNSAVRFTNTSTRYSINYSNNAILPVKSTDGGKTWTKLPGNPDNTNETYSIWADYSNPNLVIINDWSTIYFSNNGGTSFTSIHKAIDNGAGNIIGGVFFDGTNIYIGSNDGIIYSTNSGTTFTTLATTGLPTNERIFSFAAAKVGNTTRFVCLTGLVGNIYLGLAGTDYWGFIRGVYSMDNISGTWTSRTAGIDIAKDYLMFVAMAENDITTVYLGGGSSTRQPNVMKTTTAGSTWTWTHTFNTTNNQNLITGWCGTGGDKTWGYPECLFGIAVSPTNKNILVISDMSFATKSNNGGATWTQAYVDPTTENVAGFNTPVRKYYKSIGCENTSAWFLNWTDNNSMFAAYTDIFAIRSKNAGQTWAFDYTAPSTNTMYHITKNVSGTTLYAATSSVHDMYKSYRLQDATLDAGTGKVISSTDNGTTWTTLHDFGHPVYWLATDPNNTNRLYAAVINYAAKLGGIYVTNNLNLGASSTWTQLSAPPRTEGHPATMTVLNNGNLLCSFSGRRNPAGAFTASSGIFVYSPGTSTWADKTGANLKYWCHDVVLDPNDATQNTWYSCVYSGWGGNGNGMGGLYKTTNAGSSWTNILTGVDVSSCTFNPNNANELFITTHGSGLYHSANINASTPSITQVASYDFGVPERVFYNPFDKNKIWIVSFGHGIQWGDITSTGIIFNGLAEIEITIFPNPFRDNTTINFAPNGNDKYTLEIYNSIGTLVRKETDISGDTFTLNSGGLDKGMYLLKFIAINRKPVAKKILIE